MRYTQRDKQKRGSDFEAEFRASITHTGCWCHKIITGFSGTPFDYVLMRKDGRSIGVELKRTAKKTLNYSQIRNNQRFGLTDFRNKGGLSYIVCNLKNDTENRCFIIPWAEVMEDINSGLRGSIALEQFLEVPRIKLKSGKYGWDFNNLIQVEVMA